VFLAPVLLLVLLGCASTPGTASAASPGTGADPLGLPPVRTALELPPGPEPVTLFWLASELGRLTGQELTIHPQLRLLLESSKEDLEIRTPVPPGEVYPFIEGILAYNGFYLSPLKGGERPVLAVYGPGPNLGQIRPVVVERAKLDALEAHPALVCQVLLDFKNIDSRQLQTQLRQLLVDPSGILQVVPCGERSLLVQGPGTRLLGLAQVLSEVDRASAMTPDRTAPPEGEGAR